MIGREHELSLSPMIDESAKIIDQFRYFQLFIKFLRKEIFRQLYFYLSKNSLLSKFQSGPLFFLLYLNDMPNCLQNSDPSLDAEDMGISASSYDFDELVAIVNADLDNIRKCSKL